MRRYVLLVSIFFVLALGACATQVSVPDQVAGTPTTSLTQAAPTLITFKGVKYPVIDPDNVKSEHIQGLAVMKFHKTYVKNELTPERYAVSLAIESGSFYINGQEWPLSSFESRDVRGVQRIMNGCLITTRDVDNLRGLVELSIVRYKFGVWQKERNSEKKVRNDDNTYIPDYFKHNSEDSLTEVLFNIDINRKVREKIEKFHGWPVVESSYQGEERGVMDYFVVINRYNFRVVRCAIGEETPQYFMFGPVDPVELNPVDFI